ncbi:MAG: restriction endonuclease subunit S, partial [archaeon]|nr:restriction endonuclease subunit S [archaeon]
NIDEKILTNKQLNQNLENTLRLLYNSWFEKFECYDKTNGMIEDFEFGSIPKNWNAEMLYDYVNFVTGVEPGSKNYHETFEEGLIPFIRVGDLSSRDNMIFIDETLSKNKIIVPEDIVLSLDATVGIVKIGLSGSYSTGIRKLVIKNNKINKSFLFCLIKSNRIQRIINLYATGTTILHASKSVKHINFILPEKEFMNKFNLIGQPILSKLLNNLEEISKLTKLRDILLPKLMSGEIDVSNVEI